MKKDRLRDYATAAFIDYSANGFKTYEETKNIIYNAALLDAAQDLKQGRKNPVINATRRAEKAVEENTGYLLDVLAIDKTIEKLKAEGKDYIIDAVFNIYNAEYSTSRNYISRRVRRLAIDTPTAERTIYRYLKYARGIFGDIRGLNCCQ